ncbi:MAG: three-Cys-motif partner protein TcmP [Bacteroidota bacterium]|nr:three-Cys-motif partner protein TcmP [Bacteroidota bacterium]
MLERNHFGGNWTEHKTSILETYAKQFLTVFKNQPRQKLLYFDGFAGSGDIDIKEETDEEESFRTIEGAAVKILKVDTPRAFDMYYFVEKNKGLAKSLKTKIDSEFPNKQCFIQASDCNEKIKGLSKFLRSQGGKTYKALGFIDPKGMQLEWSALESLKGLPIDLWILNPTSGANRLLA